MSKIVIVQVSPYIESSFVVSLSPHSLEVPFCLGGLILLSESQVLNWLRLGVSFHYFIDFGIFGVHIVVELVVHKNYLDLVIFRVYEQ